MPRSLSILPETTPAITTARQEVQSEPFKPEGRPQPFLKIADLDRIVKPDHISAILESGGKVEVHYPDGISQSTRKYSPEKLVALLDARMSVPFISVRTRGVSGARIWVNPSRLEGFADSAVQLLLYFQAGKVLPVPGFTSEDLVPALEAAGLLVLTDSTTR